ncbi:hypothetical protein V1264_014581 [Littorina saxatilis]|uniref:Sepiapterin reductase n=2 Tax=Littorina saxatilis TaxID=31220 RepID=A0AAN9BSL7_9CAEN
MFSQKTICFVTGASRGLGKSIAKNFAAKLPAGSMIVLLARSDGDLEAVKNRLLENAPHVTTLVRQFDQSAQNQQVFKDVFSETLSAVGAKAEDFQQAVLVHNAGSLKPTVYTRNLPDVQELTQYLNTNVAGLIALTSEFLKAFPASSGVSRVVINISSLAGVQPFKSWAMYSSGKAARDMFCKVLAAEEPDIRVLSYAPGPLETEMTDKVIESEDADVHNWAKSAKAEKTLLPCDTSVAKLIHLLQKNTFDSGAHVDYYDEI